jgi:hypothetical protein
MMYERIDLSTVPSAMETLAQSWGAKPTPPAPALPRSYPSAAPRRPRRPFADSTDKGQAGFFGTEPARPNAEDERRARLDAMRAAARDIPNPMAYARLIPLDEAEAMVNAERINLVWYYRADTPAKLLHKLRCVGLCYLEDRGLTHFARAVRLVLIEERL